MNWPFLHSEQGNRAPKVIISESRSRILSLPLGTCCSLASSKSTSSGFCCSLINYKWIEKWTSTSVITYLEILFQEISVIVYFFILLLNFFLHLGVVLCLLLIWPITWGFSFPLSGNGLKFWFQHGLVICREGVKTKNKWKRDSHSIISFVLYIPRKVLATSVKLQLLPLVLETLHVMPFVIRAIHFCSSRFVFFFSNTDSIFSNFFFANATLRSARLSIFCSEIAHYRSVLFSFAFASLSFLSGSNRPGGRFHELLHVLLKVLQKELLFGDEGRAVFKGCLDFGFKVWVGTWSSQRNESKLAMSPTALGRARWKKHFGWYQFAIFPSNMGDWTMMARRSVA